MGIHPSTSIMKLFLLLLIFSTISLELVECQCEPELYFSKSHNWNKGYVGKLYLGHNWLSGPSVGWSVNITFNSVVEQLRVWDADIVSPAPGEGAQLSNVSNVVIAYRCYNSILYPCQYLHLSFLVRFAEVSEVTTSKYDISSVHETADLSDLLQSVQYCPPIPGQPNSTMAGRK